MKNFTSIHDVIDLDALVNDALLLKSNPLSHNSLGNGKTLILLFFNPSLRTRLSTQKAGHNLGMHVVSMNADQGWKIELEDDVIMDGDQAEHVKEAAAVVSRYGDILGIRTFPSLEDREKDYSDHILNAFIRYAGIPVISLESAIRHPLQSLADLMTIREFSTKRNPKIVLTWAPHPRALPQAVPNSFAEWILGAGYDLTIAHPPGYELSPDFTKGAAITTDQDAALRNADFVYAKNWSSFSDYGKILSGAKSWTISMKKMQMTSNARFMHCLPVRRNVVVEDAVLDSDHSIVIEQANNRTFAAQAVLKKILQG